MTSTRTRCERPPRLTRGLRRAVVASAVATAVAILGLANATSADTPKATPAAAATPTVTIASPVSGTSYERRSRVVARFRCSEGGVTSSIIACRGTVASGHAIDTQSDGTRSFTVTATDANGNTVAQTVDYTVWSYVNPLRAVGDLQASRIDMGVDYSGSGPILALGRAEVVLATDKIAGPESCWGRTCVPPPGDMIIYRLLDGPFAGKYIYVCEHITISVKAGQTVSAGEMIATLHQGSPNLELGWASGKGVWTLAAARRHEYPGTDPGGWSSIEGRNFDDLLAWLGAPSGYLTSVPNQRMPRGWPRLPARVTTAH